MMWKWRRSGESDVAVLAAGGDPGAAGQAVASGPSPIGDETAAVDAFAAVLRALGQHAFDLDQLSAISF